MKNISRSTCIWMSFCALSVVSNVGKAGSLYAFTAIDGAPNPGQNGGERTYVQAISDTHLIVGFAFPDDPCTYSFLFDGVAFSPINLPPSVFASAECVRAEGVNSHGEIVGTYGDVVVQARGFSIDGGVPAPIDAPGTPAGGSPFRLPYTLPRGVSNTGLITGVYEDTAGEHGFVYFRGAFRFFDVSGATSTHAQGINDFGEVVGYYADAGGTSHGFVRFLRFVKRVDVPGAMQTYANGINDFNAIVGTYLDTMAEQHGFLYDFDDFMPIDFPGGRNTQVTGINNRGQIVGSFDSSSVPNKPTRGFIANPLGDFEVTDTIDLNKPLITVEIFPTGTFNPAEVNTASLTFGRTGAEQSLASCSVGGHPSGEVSSELVCAFSTSASALQCGDTVAILVGELLDGTPIRGTDSVRIAPCKHQ
jgi:Protein of unknown function (DUF3466)